MSLTIKNKLCFVPSCPSSSKRNPKKIFFSVPKCKYARAQWYKAVGRDHPICYDTFFVCEDHFDLANDIVKNDLVDKPTMKKSVVPHLKLNTIECIIDNLVEENAKILQDLDQLGTRKVSGKMDKQFEVCRTCLATTDLKSLYDVYMPERLDEMLMMCTSLECSINDGLPIKICTNCVYELRRSYKFALKCREIDAKLRDCYKQIANDTKSAQKCVIKKEINPELVLIKNTTNSNQETPISLKDPLEIYHEPYPDLDIVKHELNDVKQEIILDQTQEEDHFQVSNISKLQHPTQRPETDYQCNICHKIFITFSMLEEHLNEHPKPKSSRDVTHPCTVCAQRPPILTLGLSVKMSNLDEIDFDKVCRTCLSTVNLKSVFNEYSVQNRLAEMLLLCTSVQYYENDGLPTQICTNCISELNESYKFALKCRETDQKLRNQLQKATPHSSHVSFEQNYNATNLISESITNPEVEEELIVIKAEINLNIESDSDTSITNSFEMINKLPMKEIKIEHMETSLGSILAKPRPHRQVFQCDICYLTFESNTLFKQHQLVCGGKKAACSSKSQQCTVCDKTFALSASLKYHMQTHTGERPYTCAICNSAFIHKGNFINHMRKHIREHPYSCKLCNSSFMHRVTLLQHIKKHTIKRAYLCPICTSSFKQRSQLRHHMRAHTKSTPYSKYTCTICDSSFDHQQTFNSHIQTHDLKPYTCTICTITFEQQHIFNSHMQTTHMNDKPHVCSVCGSSFNKQCNLDVHMRIHSTELPVSCNICDRSFRKRCELKHHMQLHTGDKSCNICGKLFRQNHSLKRHMLTHVGENQFICSICNKACVTQSELTFHMREHSCDKRFSCTVCQCSFNQRNALVRHMRTHTDDNKPYLCNFCDNSFDEKISWKIHMQTHTGEKSYSCTECGSIFGQKSHLTRHMRTHTGERPYPCSVCHKAFALNSDLTTHMRIHTGEKPYACTICDLSFAQKPSLKVHILKHTGEKPFACTLCDKSFVQKPHLTRHMLTHTGERPYMCSLCEKSFALNANLTAHMRTHTGERPFTCPVCGRGFYKSEVMKKHKEREHKV